MPSSIFYTGNDITANIFSEFKINSPFQIAEIIDEISDNGNIERINIFTEYVTRPIGNIIVDNIAETI